MCSDQIPLTLVCGFSKLNIMKLLNFEINEFSYFGVTTGNYAVSFEWLQQKTKHLFPDLDSKVGRTARVKKIYAELI